MVNIDKNMIKINGKIVASKRQQYCFPTSYGKFTSTYNYGIVLLNDRNSMNSSRFFYGNSGFFFLK